MQGRARHRRGRDARGPDGALREAARAEGRGGCGRAAASRVRRLPAHAERLRPRHHRQGADRRGACAARSATGSWCAPGSPACEQAVPLGDRRGRRRFARQPGALGVRRAAEGRGDRRGDRRARRDDRDGDQQRRRVPRPDRRPRARRRARARGRDRGPDGLQARRRADGRQLEDQAPLDEAAGHRGQPAGPDRDDVHLGAARRERPRRPARQRGAGRAARRRRADDSVVEERASASVSKPARKAEDAQARLGTTARQAHHLDPGPARRHRRHQGQALLRRTREQQPAAQRRGPRPGPRDGGVAGPAVGHVRRAGQLAGAAYAGDRRDPGASSSTSRSRRSTASPRWSSAPGTG